MKMKQALALALSMALAGSMFAAEPPQDTSTPAAKSTRKAAAKAPSVASQLNELKEAIEAQQKQIQDLSQQIQSRDAQIQQLQQRLDASQAATSQAQAKADSAAAQTAQQGQTVTALQTDVTDLKANATSTAQSLQETQKNLRDQLESPLAIHYKGITITPGGFLAAESVYRNRALGADINTPFNSVNMPGAAANHVSEFFGSGRQSRITMLAEGKLTDSLKMGGYYEADFLAAAVTSNNNESNSYVLRQRQVWGQIASPTWTLTGGQMWSLATETKKGLDNRTEAVPMTIDPQYTVGFSWDRQYGVRLVRNFNNHFWLGASVENPQTTFSARNNASNFALGSAGNASGLYNSAISTCSTSSSGVTTCTNIANYSFNAMPDFIFKAAAEPGFGHFEVFGILSRYRDRVYPCEELPTGGSPNCGTTPSVLGAYNDSQTSGGLGANGRVTIAKKLDLGAHFLTGEGIGRYGTGGLPDSTVNPDGTLGLLRSYQGLATVELHLKKVDWYMNAGEEYVGKRWTVDPITGKDVGYGPPSVSTAGCYTEGLPGAGTGFAFASGCSVDTQRLIEGTVGFWIRLHQGPHGRIQFGPQYSYLVRDAWWGTYAAATPTSPAIYTSPHGIDNMFFTSFRYYLP
jgi:cell division septum initiation protein DivIVA